MAKKRSLADLVKQEVKRPDLQTTEVTESETSTDTESPTTELTDKQSDSVTKSQPNKVTESQTSEVPKYLTLVRKETRLRDDQLEQLTAITRKLNRQRQRKGERITVRPQLTNTGATLGTSTELALFYDRNDGIWIFIYAIGDCTTYRRNHCSDHLVE